MFLKTSFQIGAVLTSLFIATPALAQDFDAMCLTVRAAATAGAASAEEASLSVATQALRLDAAGRQQACRAIACGLTDSSPEVVDAIIRGAIASGNEEVVACLANLSSLQPAAIDLIPPAPDGSPN